MLIANLSLGIKKNTPILAMKRKWVDGTTFDTREPLARLIEHLE